MATNSISSYFSTESYSLLKAATEEKQLYEQAAEVDEESGSDSSLAVDIQSYLALIPTGTDGYLSFQDVEDYLTEMEDAWDTVVMAELEGLGVDVSESFALTYNTDDGTVTVSDDCEYKEIIDQYFLDNPDRVEEFQTIVQLGKLNATATSALTQSEMMQSLQLESLTWWFEDNTDPSDWFESGGLLAIGGSTSYTGLSLTV